MKLFNTYEFEQKISEVELQKGLKLLVKNRVELIEKNASKGFTFFIKGAISGEITLEINKNEFLNYTCFCKHKSYCEHLAACFFYLQKEVLFFSENPTRKLKAFRKVKQSVFFKYVLILKQLVKPLVSLPKLTDVQIVELLAHLNIEQALSLDLKNTFYFNLAVFCELTKLQNFKYSALSVDVLSQINKAMVKLDQHFFKGLSNIEKEAFILATHYSVQSQQNFKSESFSFLISRASIILKDKHDFQKLKIQLKKRKLNKNSLEAIDKKLIAEIQLIVMENKLSGQITDLKKYQEFIELPLALAELEFLQKQDAKAFKLLKDASIKIKSTNINKYLDFVDWVLFYAKQKHNLIEQEFYFLEKFIFGYFIDNNELDIYLNINHEKSKYEKTNNLLQKIKEESKHFNFEKLTAILLSQDRIDELIDEIKSQKNKFKLLHILAIKKLPTYDGVFLKLYCKHLLQAITEAKFAYFQEQLITLAKSYFDGLPTKIIMPIIEELKDKTLYNQNAYAFINKLYPSNNN